MMPHELAMNSSAGQLNCQNAGAALRILPRLGDRRYHTGDEFGDTTELHSSPHGNIHRPTLTFISLIFSLQTRRSLVALALWFLPFSLYTQDATSIIRKADELMRGTSSYAQITMTVIKPEWQRTMTMKAWSLEPHFSLVYMTQPARDKGTVTLKRGNEVWNWLPSVQKVIKIPPSMMLQSWMGSDFTNDDLVRASSIVNDYTHSLLGRELYAGQECYKIQLIPKPEAGVVWAKVLVWISVAGYLELKTEYYDENGSLVKSFLGSAVKTFGDRKLPSHWEMVPHDAKGDKTVLNYDELRFNITLTPDFFSLQNMKRVH